MSLKNFGVTLLAVVALGAVTAGSASALATTTAAEWYTGSSTGSTLFSSERLQMIATTGFDLESKVGSSATPIKLTASGIECKSCTIENREITGKGGSVAFGSGQVNFTGVTVDEPSTCSVTSEAGVTGQILSRPLNIHADLMNGSTAVQQLIPAAGEGKSLAAFKLANASGKTCPVAGLYSITGILFADATNKTGVQSMFQQINISPTIESFDGGGLKIGSQEARLTGSAQLTVNSGAAFGVH